MRSLFEEVARAAAMVVLLAAALALAQGATAPQPLRAWRDGPVRVLLNGDEYDRFGALKTDAEREAFIDAFWKQLDANPGPNETSFRATFEARCAIANLRYQTINQPGWRTERGRVFIALGEPKAIRQESGGARAIAKEVWIYGTPGAAGASLEIAFFRCADGSYRTDPSCPVDVDPTSVSFDWQRNNYLRTLRDNNPGLSLVRVRALLNDLLANLPRTTTQAAAAPPSGGGADPTGGPPDDRVASSGGVLRVAPYYFRAQDGSVLAFVLMDVRDDADPAKRDGGAPEGPYVAAVSFEETGKGGVRQPDASTRSAALEPIERAGARPVFFGRAYLESGRTYAARYALEDTARGELLVKHDVLTVPDLGDGFSVSSLVPAERFGPAGTAAGRYRVGSEEVVPKPDAAFHRSEMLRLYVQVYGAAIDPARQAPRVDVVFRFQRVIKGTPKRFRKPFSVQEASGAAIGLEVPVGDWPPGPYRVSVDLHDRVSGERIGVGGAFTILED